MAIQASAAFTMSPRATTVASSSLFPITHTNKSLLYNNLVALRKKQRAVANRVVCSSERVNSSDKVHSGGKAESIPAVAIPSEQGSSPNESSTDSIRDDSALTIGLVFTVGSSSSWDAAAVASPVVRRYERGAGGNDAEWCMWYQGWAFEESSEEGEGGKDAERKGSEVEKEDALESSAVARLWRASAGIALSSNGLHWVRGEQQVETDARGRGGAGLVLKPSSDWWKFDTRHVGVSDVLIMASQKVRANSGVFWMFYSGGDAEEVPLPAELGSSQLLRGLGILDPKEAEGAKVEGLRQRPGLAMSHDGRNWARIEGAHHSGALFDVGTEGEWDSLFVGAPQVVFHEPGDIRMYYHSLDPRSNTFCVGAARSPDGLKWVKLGKILGSGPEGAFDEAGVTARHVLRDPRIEKESEGGYVMVYEGVSSDNTSSIGLATSKDGWTWERSAQILGPSPLLGAWDGLSVGSPCLVDMGGGRTRLYYVGVGANGQQGIGAAECEDGSLMSFVRCSVLPSVP